jgi:hypothetical protein
MGKKYIKKKRKNVKNKEQNPFENLAKFWSKQKVKLKKEIKKDEKHAKKSLKTIYAIINDINKLGK